LIRAADGLQHRARLTFGACRGLPHSILDAKLYEGSKIGIVEIQDWLIKPGTRVSSFYTNKASVLNSIWKNMNIISTLGSL
jgi:hypothetical protein